MKKQLLYLFLIAVLFNACEKDDICLQPVTPKLVLRFYDNANPTSKKAVKNLSIWAEGKDTLKSYKSVNVDSVALPLNINANQTVYYLKMNNTTGNKAANKYNKLTINYSTKEIYVSRSCGFKTLFNNVTFISNNGWFQSFTPTSLTTIDNENKAHVKIYY
ncbi:MAG: hypothetical protein HWD85_01430 [Flavobacteriaceae bacterium]|nr:hypothetical protein [Flavobacteriaceae bacterium]